MDERVVQVPMEADQVRLLVMELDLAIALLELARISRDFECRRRNYKHARQSYEAALALIPALKLTGEAAREISSRLSQLQDWLDSTATAYS
jgi:hypothetical protein